MSSSRSFDAVVIGAGSVGTPLAMSLAARGLSTLCIDPGSSAGQGNNKCAIGGVRATHTERAKVALSLRSLEVFGTWQGVFGDAIGWRRGGYLYVAYDTGVMELFGRNVPGQRSAGLDISLVGPGKVMELVPGISADGLLGGTWSPGDGSANPMQACYAFHRRAVELGAVFRFREKVTGFRLEGENRITSVRTDRAEYPCGAVFNCSGSFAAEVGRMAGIELPVLPESHEAGITEPVQDLFAPMIVDIRKAPGSTNYYFYQHATGQVVFCITPDPPIPGTETGETSGFLPLVSSRMSDLYPRLANLKVRRVWRGVYPMTPDGSPLLGQVGPGNHFVAVGMCGQGFMLGPGIGETLARLLVSGLSETDRMILQELNPLRRFRTVEVLT
jgi:sarcosine oxidase, subunit beta